MIRVIPFDQVYTYIRIPIYCRDVDATIGLIRNLMASNTDYYVISGTNGKFNVLLDPTFEWNTRQFQYYDTIMVKSDAIAMHFTLKYHDFIDRVG